MNTANCGVRKLCIRSSMFLDYENLKFLEPASYAFGFYCIFLKDVKCGDLKYSKQTYDYQEGTLVFVSPGQFIDVQNKTDEYRPSGHGLVFHPDLLLGTSLGKMIEHYSFSSINRMKPCTFLNAKSKL